MFGFVTASFKELTKEQQHRYQTVYCGICRQIRIRTSQTARLGLSYDMAFLALLLMSLYEPEETDGKRACSMHPLRPRPWVDNTFIQYAADMNVALAYYKAQDDWNDDQSLSAKIKTGIFGSNYEQIAQHYPRQCRAISDCIAQIRTLEEENCSNPDLLANSFGTLMGELLVYDEDMWAPTLRRMGMGLGRFIYLADAAVDYRRDLRKKKYNPYVAMGCSEDWSRWEDYLVLAMSRCTEEFEKLPLVQDKALLDNILYSGVWGNFKRKKEEGRDGRE
ncbi:MAG: hypothetical protein E7454_02715 [Ruminococcaceae bacterium]|nr:hypothetical protein [Oscillospiraceae bacterium]